MTEACSALDEVGAGTEVVDGLLRKLQIPLRRVFDDTAQGIDNGVAFGIQRDVIGGDGAVGIPQRLDPVQGTLIAVIPQEIDDTFCDRCLGCHGGFRSDGGGEYSHTREQQHGEGNGHGNESL